MTDSLSAEGQSVVTAPFRGHYTVFLEGPAGVGKTTLGVARVRYLLQGGVPASEMMVIVPQRTLGLPYTEALQAVDLPGGVPVEVVTVGSLARRHVELFWPLVAQRAGFAEPARPPVFLTLETAQYYMDRVAGPVLEARGFEGVTIHKNRLISQLIDNLNKAAVVGFEAGDIAERLKRAWTGETSQARIFDQAQACALDFRGYCLQHNLLDFSLQLEVFMRHLLPLPAFRQYLFGRYQHLIVDNVEEDTPVAHDLLRAWLPHCESALIIYDREGGYRAFLGADPVSAMALKEDCQTSVSLGQSRVTTPDLDALRVGLAETLGGPSAGAERTDGDANAAFGIVTSHYQPEMLEQVAQEVSRLVTEEGVPPGEIVVLAPFLSDALRFTLADRLTRCGLRIRSHRPSRALREEPATRCLLTLAALAHPHWKMAPPAADVVQALMQTIEGLDLVRAHLLTQIVYRPRESEPALSSFDGMATEAQDRITYSAGERYERLRSWLTAYRERGMWAELDHFFSLLFGEVLSQRDFGFHRNFDAARQTANLIESVRKFRQVVSVGELPVGRSVGQEYVETVQRGVVAAQYVQSWQAQPEEAVLLAPAYTFLMYNRPVDYQFWINAGSAGWWERIYQPLTHPYVLSRGWSADALWTDADEFVARQTALRRLAAGLLRRCRKRIYIYYNRMGEQGYEESGPLIQAFHRMHRRLSAVTGGEHD